ncbi:hypothetical protein BJX63DRAFT_433969 [Aspergillus granulosus]|uniref:Uncharacterized protein n=1 Tax=Aspergillus granulosus TaxID=176169 RepID=A0ABR4H5I2_9EURO
MPPKNKKSEKKVKDEKNEKPKRDSFGPGDFFIPANVAEWKVLAANGKLTGKSIHDILNMDSGSNVRKRQFTMFRALWLRKKGPMAVKVEAGELGLQLAWPRAENLLSQSTEYSRYLHLISLGMPIEELTETSGEWPGSFMPLLEL